MSKPEIITLQLGTYSNYVATNYWNLQESALDSLQDSNTDIGVIFRHGQNLKGEFTFSPRTVSVDIHNPLYNPMNYLHNPYNEAILDLSQMSQNDKKFNWLSNKLEVIRISDDSKIKNPSIDHWSQFMYGSYHPKSYTNIMNHPENEFISFDNGLSEFSTLNKDHAFTDSVRFFAEECNNFQGFQILTDIHNGFSGLSTRCIYDIQDDYPKKTRIMYPVYPSTYKHEQDDNIYLINTMLAFDKFKDNVDLVVPLSLKCDGWRNLSKYRHYSLLQYNVDSWLETSSILSLALFTLWEPFKQRTESFTLKDLCKVLQTDLGQKFAIASLELPFYMKEDSFLLDCLKTDKCPGYRLSDLPISPFIYPQVPTVCVSQVVSLCGIPQTRLKNCNFRKDSDFDSNAYLQSTVKDLLQYYYFGQMTSSSTYVFHNQKAIKFNELFPKIFDTYLNEFGYVSNVRRTTDMKEVPVQAGFHTGPFMRDYIHNLCATATKIPFNRYSRYYNGLKPYIFKKIINDVSDIQNSYDSNY